MSSALNPEDGRLDPALAALATGSRVGAGRFTLLRLLGRGGMGVVWLARDEQLREGVALKFLPPEIRHDALALDDLRRETSRSRKLTHPHIIRIHDLYKVDDEAFISMEYIDGPNLSELRLQQPDRVLRWNFLEPLIKQLCEALEYAHSEHIVHRDLKPANMMLDGRGRLKLADFGIAAVVTDSFSRMSRVHHLLSGTACYMSPQQLDGKPPQVTDDVYSLGATLYELLTSRAPFFTGDIAHQVRTFAAQPVEKRLAQLNLRNPVPPAVSAAILACLAKEPEKRPQTAPAIAEQIGLGPLAVGVKSDAPAAEQSPAEARATVPKSPAGSPEPAAAPVPSAQPSKSPSVETLPENRLDIAWKESRAEPDRRDSNSARQRRGPAIAMAAVLLMILLTAAGWWSSQRHASNNATQATKKAVPEFIPLFNGHDFAGWDGDPQVWFIQDGAITATNGTSRERRPLALFWRGGVVDDFELRLSFRIKSGNSGIYYRAKQLLGYEVGGYQFEISGPQTGLLIETGPDRMRRQPSQLGFVTSAQVINGKEKVTQQSPTPSSATDVKNAFHPKDWNHVVIIVQSNRVIHQLNGHTVVDTTDTYDRRPHSGTVALEVYGLVPTSVQFRDIRLKHLRSRPN